MKRNHTEEKEQEYGVTPAADNSVLAVEEPIDATAADATGPVLVAEPEPPSAEAVAVAALAEMKTERDQLLDRLARLQAEFDNARKRAERERLEFRDYATGVAVEQFLPVIDNFELALKADGTLEQMRSGVELIVKQMEEVLRQMQITPIATVGEPFDPRLHEALGAVERDDMPDNYVAEEIRRGYKLRERMLRPAMVRVVTNPKQTSA